MIVASIVVETLPGKARAVVERMEQIRGMGPLSADGDRRITGTWTVPDGDTVEGLSEVLRALNPEILCVFPTMGGEEDS